MADGDTPVHAAASGNLCVANNTTTHDGVHLWRNSSFCTIVDDATTSAATTYSNTTQWDYDHALYIVHGNSYSSWYVHVVDVLDGFRQQFIDNGYVHVDQGQQIAIVGNYSLGYAGGVGYHLHFGIRNYKGKRDDPYGNGIPTKNNQGNFNVLWQERPDRIIP